MARNSDRQLKIRLPKDLDHFLESESRLNSSSKSSEIVRAVRERAERLGHRSPRAQKEAGNV